MRAPAAVCVVIGTCIVAGCASPRAAEETPPIQPDAAVMNLPLPPYSGSKARLAVSSFTLKAAKATAEIGTGLREMFVSALTQSNRFVVSERAETAGQRPADLAVVVAVTQFEPQSSGGRAGIGGGGGAGSGVLGSLIGSSGNAAQLALELRIIDPVTSDVISQTVVKGQALDATGGVLQGVFGGWSLGAGLSAYANTPMEKAVRTCIIDAVRYVSDAVPSGYYRE